MKLVIAGGCGDCGRNAFYIEGNGHAFILDCGVSTDGLNRIPDFTVEQLEKAEFLFLSHSHKDHSGAIEYVEDMGYTGPVLMSNRTYQQLSYKPKNTMILDSTAPELELLPDVRIKWGLTGHCAGSVWYLIQVGGKRVFYSGDYREGDVFYRCQPIRDIIADLAIMEAHLDRGLYAQPMRRQVMDTLFSLMEGGKSVLLPVSLHGRGLSIASALALTPGFDRPIFMSENLWNQWQSLARRHYFVNEEIFNIPLDRFRCWDGKTLEGNGIYFLTDSQLGKAENRQLVDGHPDMPVLLTGPLHGYGQAREYVESGRIHLAVWPNHTSLSEMEEIVRENTFGKVIPFHNEHMSWHEEMVEF